MDPTAEGELVNLISVNSSHSVLLLCPDKVQLAQQLRCLTWPVLGVSAVRVAAGVTDTCAAPGAGKGGSGICSKNVHLCHRMFGYVGAFSSFLLPPLFFK